MAAIDFTVRPDTVVDAFRRLRDLDDHGHTFLDNALKPTFYSFKRLWEASEARGRSLLALGAKRGDRIAMVLAQPEDFVISFLGCLVVGLVPVPMYPPLSFGKLDAYADSAVNILEVAGAAYIVTDKQLSNVLWQVVPRVKTIRDLYTIDKLDSVKRSDEPLAEVVPADLAFLQFTSGSTSAPKGVMVSHRALVANTWAIADQGMKIEHKKDKAVSWLPLYHDMGLIGFVITPIMKGVDVVFIPTLAFVKRPNVWLQTLHEYQGTISFGPNFAFALASKRASDADKAKWDLSRVRGLGCGAEPIHPAVMQEFSETFAPCGLSPNAIMPAYGMAEATLAMAFGERDEPFGTLVVDAEAFRAEGLVKDAADDALALSFVSCGKPFPLHELGTMDADGNLLPEGQEGEIVFRGPSVTEGYWQNEEATRACFLPNGWLRTGDLGFQWNGETYITGRCKDLIILNGRNHHPQTIEWAVQEIEGVRRGNAVAFSRPGVQSEELVIVAEKKSDASDDLPERIVAAVAEQLSLKVVDVVLLGAGQLPKTSSGKLQRRKTREQYLAGSLGGEGVRTLGSTGETLTVAKHMARSLLGRASHVASKVFSPSSPRN